MWIVKLALNRPYTFVVLSLMLVVLGLGSIKRMPKDIFPTIDEPIVTLIRQYVGIPADAFEKQITIFSEQQINTTVSNGRRIESHTIYGKNVILAARIAGQAQGGEILVSSLLKELTESAAGVAFGEGREVELKGLAGPHRVFEVVW